MSPNDLTLIKAADRRLAEQLRQDEYVDKWVAVQDFGVVAVAETQEELSESLCVERTEYEMAFPVPDRDSVAVLGIF